MIGYSFMDLQMVNFVNRNPAQTLLDARLQIQVQDSCVQSARISYVLIICMLCVCVQIVNVYAFDETRNVIQCKLGDELEMSQRMRANERTNESKKELFNA